jgi:hypothetical protein
MILRNLFIFVYLLSIAVIFSVFELSIGLWLSFFCNTIILTLITYYHIFIERCYSPFLSTYIVFNFLFFIVAPIVQADTLGATEIGLFENKYPFNELTFIKTNGLIAIFHVVFFLFYVSIKGYIKIKPKREGINTYAPTALLRDNAFIIFVSVFIILMGLPFLIDEYVRPAWSVSPYSPGFQLILKKILYTIPLAGIVICKLIFDRRGISTQVWFINLIFLGVLFFLLVVVKNPLIEKRNALGPIYLLVAYLFFPRLFNSNVKTSLMLFTVMVIGFPLVQVLTHINYGFEELFNRPSLLLEPINNGVLSEGFMSLNYDAFINIGVAMEVVQEKGFSYGYQLLSALLFFVPRTIWPGKPESSGLVLGDYLIENYNFNFANISNPVVSEGYMNFGVAGVIIMAIALAISVVFFLTWLNSNDYLKQAVAFYFAIHLLFLLRGDFTNGYSYFVGTFLGLYVVPKIIFKISHLLLDQKIWIVKKG